MSTCHCDGPPHTYDPSWCREGRTDRGTPLPVQDRVPPAPTCRCDGPPHSYDPSWCRSGRGDNGRPIHPGTSW